MTRNKLVPMTERESVLWDAMLQAGYTERQAARALVALTLPDTRTSTRHAISFIDSKYGKEWAALDLELEAERRGLLKEES